MLFEATDNLGFRVIDDSVFSDNRFAIDSLMVYVDQQLATALDEMEQLKARLSGGEAARLLDLCKDSVVSSITGHFGLASALLSNQDGGNVTTTHNFAQGITSSEADRARYVEFQRVKQLSGQDWQAHRKAAGYDGPLHDMRKQRFQQDAPLVDAYTGKPLNRDGRTHVDHVVSAREIADNAQYNLHMSEAERAAMATSDSNLAYTDSGLNQSKGDKSMQEFLDHQNKDGTRPVEKFDIDREKAMARDREAREAMQREANKKAFHKYSRELIATGARDAGRQAVYSAMGFVVKELAEAAFRALRKVFEAGFAKIKQAFAVFKAEMQTAMESIKANWKGAFSKSVQDGLMAFFSNIIVFLINMFATTLKRITSVIRAGFTSLVAAVKLLMNPPAHMHKDEIGFEALKVVSTGVIGASAMLLGESIKSVLVSVPALTPLMAMPVPFMGAAGDTVGDVMSVVLSGIVGGLLSTVAVYWIDKLKHARQKDKMQIQLISQSGLVVDLSMLKSWGTLYYAFDQFGRDIDDYQNMAVATSRSLDDGMKQIEDSARRREEALARMKNRRNR